MSHKAAFAIAIATGDIVLQRYCDNVYIRLFVNIEIKTLRSYIQQSGVVLKTV